MASGTGSGGSISVDASETIGGGTVGCATVGGGGEMTGAATNDNATAGDEIGGMGLSGAVRAGKALASCSFALGDG